MDAAKFYSSGQQTVVEHYVNLLYSGVCKQGPTTLGFPKPPGPCLTELIFN